MMRADKREEDALRQVNERLEQAIDSISDAFVWYDADGKLVLCNQNHRDFFPHLGDIYHPGISREEIFRHHAEAMFEKDPTFKVEDYLSERRKLTHTPRPDREAQLFDGRWVAIRERPVAGGGMVSIRTDITDRKKTQDTIAGLLKQNELILASTGDGIFGLDLEGRTTFANAAMARMTGWGAEELIGKFLHDIFRHTRPDGNPCPREECSICIAHNDSKAYRVYE